MGAGIAAGPHFRQAFPQAFSVLPAETGKHDPAEAIRFSRREAIIRLPILCAILQGEGAAQVLLRVLAKGRLPGAKMPAFNARRSLSRVPGKGFKHLVRLPGSTLADIACRRTVVAAQTPDFSVISGTGSLRFHRSDIRMLSPVPSRSKRNPSVF